MRFEERNVRATGLIAISAPKYLLLPRLARILDVQPARHYTFFNESAFKDYSYFDNLG